MYINTMLLPLSNILRCQKIIQKPVTFSSRNWHRDHPIPVTWEKPQLGWTKLNYDGSCKGKDNKSSIGGVFRNHNAEFVLGYAESIGKSTSTIAEFTALGRGLELALENGWSNVWMEGDAKTIVEILVRGKPVKCSELQEQVWYINSTLPKLDKCIVSHVYREGNRVAHELARLGHKLEEPRVWWDNLPQHIERIVNEDAEGKIVMRRR